MGQPKVETPKPTALERAQAEAAERERIEAARNIAERRTAQLARLFGLRGGFGFGRI
jgi:hypothetical protein